MTNAYVALLRGINVGGKNIISMADLAQWFNDAGYQDVQTYIQSGNVVFRPPDLHDAEGAKLEAELEEAISAALQKPIMVVVRSRAEIEEVVAAAPQSHGDEGRRSDVIFLKHPERAAQIFQQFPALQEGVDEAHLGSGVIYFSRLAAQASKSRLSRIVGTAVYREMTIRNWRTTNRLLQMLSRSGE